MGSTSTPAEPSASSSPTRLEHAANTHAHDGRAMSRRRSSRRRGALSRGHVLAVVLGALALGGVLFACGSDDAPPACEGPACVDGAADATPADGGADGRVDGDGPADAADAGDAADATSACPGPAGTLDPTFGDGGMVWLRYPGSGASSVVFQADGKVLVGGGVSPRTFALVRLLPNGAPDPSFGNNGLVETKVAATFNGTFTSLAVQGDGKIIATGKADLQVGQRSYDFAVVRYLPNGELDQSFGSGGSTTTDFGAADFTSDSPESVVVQPDGRILVGGRTGSPADLAVVRYLADGSPDLAFGVGGRAIVDVQGTADSPGVLVRLATGKIALGGGTLKTSPPLRTDTSAVQLNADGTPDQGFADAGKLVVDLGGGSNAFAIAADLSGKTVLAGQVAPGDFSVLRVTPTGSLDPTFGVGGVVGTDFGGRGDEAHAVLLQSDGRIVVAGQSLGTRPGDPDMGIALARYLPSGALDTSFGTAGRTLITPAVDTSYGVSAAALSGCSVIVVGGWQYDNTTMGKTAMGIARFRR